MWPDVDSVPDRPLRAVLANKVGANSRETVGGDCLQVVPHFRKGLLANGFDGSSSLFAACAMI